METKPVDLDLGPTASMRTLRKQISVYGKTQRIVIEKMAELRSQKDDNYFNLAEKFLYGEFAISLGMSYDEVKKYVVNRVEQLNNDD